MPSATPAAVRKQIAQGKPDPVYLIIGDDDADMSRLAGDLAALVEDELRAFNSERLYANEKGVTAASIVESARTLPMMGERRVVMVLRGERLLKPKRRAKAAVEEAGREDTSEDDGGEPSANADELEAYLKSPEPLTTLVIVATDADRTRRLYKALVKNATIVECWGLKGFAQNPRDVRGWELEKIAREASALVARTVKEAGYTIDPAAARLIAVRAGTDIVTLRGDLERLMLYVGDRKAIDVRDVQEIVSGETLQDQWALNEAIVQKDARKALRQLGLAMESGSVPYMILGQLAYCVREKVAAADARRVPAAMEALFRTDLDMKSSGGDPRVLLERLVVELCRR
jgi:DNA polymerase-3 subunit delta